MPPSVSLLTFLAALDGEGGREAVREATIGLEGEVVEMRVAGFAM